MAMDHIIPPVPSWVKWVRCAQMVLTITCIGLWASTLTSCLEDVWKNNGPAHTDLAMAAFSLNLIFEATALFYLLYVLITHTCSGRGYYKWFALGWESLIVFFLFVGVVHSGLVAAQMARTTDNWDSRKSNTSENIEYYALVSATAYFGAANWALFVLTLIFLSIGCHYCRIGRVDANGRLMNGAEDAENSRRRYKNMRDNFVPTGGPAPPSGYYFTAGGQSGTYR